MISTKKNSSFVHSWVFALSLLLLLQLASAFRWSLEAPTRSSGNTTTKILRSREEVARVLSQLHAETHSFRHSVYTNHGTWQPLRQDSLLQKDRSTGLFVPCPDYYYNAVKESLCALGGGTDNFDDIIDYIQNELHLHVRRDWVEAMFIPVGDSIPTRARRSTPRRSIRGSIRGVKASSKPNRRQRRIRIAETRHRRFLLEGMWSERAAHRAAQATANKAANDFELALIDRVVDQVNKSRKAQQERLAQEAARDQEELASMLELAEAIDFDESEHGGKSCEGSSTSPFHLTCSQQQSHRRGSSITRGCRSRLSQGRPASQHVHGSIAKTRSDDSMQNAPSRNQRKGESAHQQTMLDIIYEEANGDDDDGGLGDDFAAAPGNSADSEETPVNTALGFLSMPMSSRHTTVRDSQRCHRRRPHLENSLAFQALEENVKEQREEHKKIDATASAIDEKIIETLQKHYTILEELRKDHRKNAAEQHNALDRRESATQQGMLDFIHKVLDNNPFQQQMSENGGSLMLPEGVGLPAPHPVHRRNQAAVNQQGQFDSEYPRLLEQQNMVGSQAPHSVVPTPDESQVHTTGAGQDTSPNRSNREEDGDDDDDDEEDCKPSALDKHQSGALHMNEEIVRGLGVDDAGFPHIKHVPAAASLPHHAATAQTRSLVSPQAPGDEACARKLQEEEYTCQSQRKAPIRNSGPAPEANDQDEGKPAAKPMKRRDSRVESDDVRYKQSEDDDDSGSGQRKLAARPNPSVRLLVF
jgi:hypothetical protein